MNFISLIFPPRPWSKLISKTNGRSLDIFRYCCCCTRSTQIALNRVISFWSVSLLLFSTILLFVCLSSSSTSNPFTLLRALFPTIVDSITNDIGKLLMLLYTTSVLGIITGFVGVITASTYSVIFLKICMVCNYINIIKDFIFFITIIVLLKKWSIAFIQAVVFFVVLFSLSILIGVFCSFVAENLLFFLENENDDASTNVSTETTSITSTGSKNTKNEDNKDIESATHKDDEYKALIS
ncbi:hypothetical protein FG386_001924 [Cryptosporidium ryanae]|uniref:uncharacterized protein n=1 Tax=Cryptosporidium ryanae TaxID=515981 RepID=UPI00351A2F40|nr:hypothetical protein FG386_001924 [Cryptosporidium ryanae]